MTDDLLDFYNRELGYLAQLNGEFARAHPKMAARLGLGQEGLIDNLNDPHLKRMLQGVAYLNARVRAKLDDDFPELSEALLEFLYPQHLAPIPSATILQLSLKPGVAETLEMPRAETELWTEADPVSGAVCRFRSCYPVTLRPIKVDSARWLRAPAPAPRVGRSDDAAAVLQLVLQSTIPGQPLGLTGGATLRFFLAGERPQVEGLYQALFSQCIQVAAARDAEDREAVALGARALGAVGFDPEESLLPTSAQGFAAYRLLSEYFAFPQKFWFFDCRVAPGVCRQDQERLVLFFYLAANDPLLERTGVDASGFLMGCTPAINLFSHPASPVALDHARAEYEVVPDPRRREALEVYTVDRVAADNGRGEQRRFRPFFGIHHGDPGGAGERCFYQVQRRPALHYGGSETYLSLVDLDLEPRQPTDATLVLRTTCFNRDLPGKLPFGGGQPRLQFVRGGANAEARCLTRPTPTQRIPAGQSALWRLISHLILNQLSISDGAVGADALKEMLQLYDRRDAEETRDILASIREVRCRPVNGRIPGGGLDAFARGVEVRVDMDPQRLAGQYPLLFSALLEHFLGLYCSVNSFVRLILTTEGGKRIIHRWPDRSGEHALL